MLTEEHIFPFQKRTNTVTAASGEFKCLAFCALKNKHLNTVRRSHIITSYLWFNGSLHWPVYNTGSPDSIWVGPEKRRDESPWVPIVIRPFPNGQANAGSWLGTKNALYYCAQSTNSISWVLFVSSYMTTIDSITACLAHAPKNCMQSGNFQFDINSPFQNTVYPKTTDPFPKIQAWAYNRYSHLPRSCLHIYYGVKDAMTADTKTSHEKWICFFSVFIVIIPTCLLCQVQANSSGAEFLSTISKFIEKKKILSCCLFTSFPERKNRHFDVVVV